MKIDQEKLAECEWRWNDDQKLLRNASNVDNLELDPLGSVDIYGVPYTQGGGRVTYAQMWDINSPDVPILVETRDYSGDDEYIGYPIMENARIVPEDDQFYKPVMEILTKL